jgi:hypothetical protein
MKLLGLVRSITFCFSSFNAYILYFILVRYNLEYACIVWNSITSTDAKKLELSFCFSRFLPHVYWSYAYALEQLKLRTLRKRRYYLDALLSFQVCFGSKFYRLLETVGLRVHSRYTRGFPLFIICSSNEDVLVLDALQLLMFVCRDVDVLGTKIVPLNNIL